MTATFLVKEPMAYAVRYWLQKSESFELHAAFVKAVNWKWQSMYDGQRCFVLQVYPELLIAMADVHAGFGMPPLLPCFTEAGLTPHALSYQLEIWAWALDVGHCVHTNHC